MKFQTTCRNDLSIIKILFRIDSKILFEYSGSIHMFILISLIIACGPKKPTDSDLNVNTQLLSESIHRGDTVTQHVDLTGDGNMDIAIVLEPGMLEQRIDINGDKKVDVINHYKLRDDNTKALVFKSVDLNWDGKIDVYTWFDVKGQISKEAMDGDFDGITEWVDHYEGNQLVMSEIDTNFDGRYDLFRYYENELLVRKEHDSDGDGKIDFWQYFDTNGNVKNIGRDTDGDEKIDIRE